MSLEDVGSREYWYYKCTNAGCNEKLEIEYGQVRSHSYTNCSEIDWQYHGWYCSNCGDGPVDRSSHSYGSKSKDYLGRTYARCTSCGSWRYYDN